MAALVAAALAGVGDRPAWLAAILADRFRSPSTVTAAGGLAVLAAALAAAAGGALLAPRLTPEASLLMLALALALQGGGALLPAKPPERLDRWRLGAFGTALAGMFILAFGDGVQFVVVALAARSPLPWLAAVGAALGSLAAIGPAASRGEARWNALPLRAVRLVIALLFLGTAAVLALSALRLV